MSNTRFRIGIDLGGTKTSFIVMDQTGKIYEKKRRPSPRHDYTQTINELVEVVTNCLAAFPEATSVGIGVPGSISPVTGKIQNANSTWLNGRSLQEDLAATLPIPVRIANDANCFALSEAIDGAGAEGNNIFGVILGTGCGGGFVIEKKLLNGPRGIAGEWGHNPLPWPEKSELGKNKCWCGLYDCIETWISGPGFSADHLSRTGQELSAREIVDQAQAGNNEAQLSIRKLTSRIARGLAGIVNIFDPDIIVLGGGLSQIDSLYTELPDQMAPYIFCDHNNITIKPPVHGDDSGVRGAARLWEPQDI